MMRVSLLFLSLVALALSAGCATVSPTVLYDGPDRSPAEVAVLRVPYTVGLMSVGDRDGPGENPFARTAFADVHLLPGTRALTLRYHDIWPVGYDDAEHETLRSKDVLLEVTLAAGGRYAIEHDEPATLKEAQRLAKHPVFRVVRLDREVPVQQRTSAPVRPEPLRPPSLPADLKPESSMESAPEPAPERLDSLKRLWRAADADERAAFMQWIVAP